MSRVAWQTEVEQIENIADTKGVEINDVEVVEDTTDEGDEIVLFRVFSESGPKTQITKMPNIQTSGMRFRDDVQNKISALKQHINGENDPENLPEPDEESEETVDSDGDRQRTLRPQPQSDGPGSQIDAEIEAIHDRLDDMEERIDDLEDKSEALDALKQLTGGSD